jgi:hypothetical protein
MKNNILISFFVLALLVLFASCEKVTDWYLGINLQPEFTEDTFEEGMNIFGLLRPDSHAEFNKSFVFVQQNWPALEFPDGSFSIIKDIEIQVIQIENEIIIDTFHFPLLPADSNFGDTLYRSDRTFIPVPGNTYRLLCTHAQIPSAMGETIFPPEPNIVPNSLKVSAGVVEFDVAADPGISMLDIYVSSDVYTGMAGRYVTNDTTSIRIHLSLPGAKSATIAVYGFDAKLSAYYANSNTSLNFNKYRTTFSTLEEGFGVFGALNFKKFTVDIP